MSRIRSIKPEFWTSAQILECSTNARLLFIGLWNFCDDMGRHPFSPKQVKAEVFPADPFSENDILGMLKELSTNGLILAYAVDGKEFLQVTGWKHQRIDKPQPAKYPGPFQEESTNIPIVIPPDRIGEDRKGKKDSVASATRSRGSTLPEDWKPCDKHYEEAVKLNLGKAAVDQMADDMRTWAIANANRAVARKADWDATFRNWLRRNAGNRRRSADDYSV